MGNSRHIVMHTARPNPPKVDLMKLRRCYGNMDIPNLVNKLTDDFEGLRNEASYALKESTNISENVISALHSGALKGLYECMSLSPDLVPRIISIYCNIARVPTGRRNLIEFENFNQLLKDTTNSEIPDIAIKSYELIQILVLDRSVVPYFVEHFEFCENGLTYPMDENVIVQTLDIMARMCVSEEGISSVIGTLSRCQELFSRQKFLVPVCNTLYGVSQTLAGKKAIHSLNILPALLDHIRAFEGNTHEVGHILKLLMSMTVYQLTKIDVFKHIDVVKLVEVAGSILTYNHNLCTTCLLRFIACLCDHKAYRSSFEPLLPQLALMSYCGDTQIKESTIEVIQLIVREPGVPFNLEDVRQKYL
ncbi:hypothetical protein PCE1_001861 [Barthelona sp. PCE]